MKVIIVKKSVYCYEPDIQDYIIGVRETIEEADALIEKDKHKNDHPLMTNEEWCSLRHSYNHFVEDLMKCEKASPKHGGWLNKYPIEQIPKKKRLAYEKLCELNGTMSFPEFFQKYLSNDVMWEEFQRTRNHDEYDAHKHLLMSFLTGTELTLDEYKYLKKHYEDVIDPKDVSYYKEYYDTKGDAIKEEEFLKND